MTTDILFVSQCGLSDFLTLGEIYRVRRSVSGGTGVERRGVGGCCVYILTAVQYLKMTGLFDLN